MDTTPKPMLVGEGIPLEDLIRITDSVSQEPRVKSVIFDTTRKEVFQKRPWITLGRVIHTYAVQIDTWTRDRVVRCPLRLSGRPPSEAIMLYVSYALYCPSERQDRAVAALIGDSGNGCDYIVPWEDRLFRYIEDYVEGEARTGRDAILDFFDRRNEMIRQLTSRVASETGLSVRLRLQLDGEIALEKLTEITIATQPFKIRPKSLEGDLTVVVRGPLRTLPLQRGKALLQLLAAKEKEAALQELVEKDIREVVQNFVSSELAISDFVLANLPATKQRVLTRLNDALGDRQGRAFDHIDFDLPHPVATPLELVQFDLTTNVRPRESQSDLPINSNVSMQLDNPGKYQAACLKNHDVSNPKKWLGSHIEQIVKSALFKNTYVELILCLDDESIRRLLTEKAGEIGYSIKHYSAVPDQPILKLKREGVQFVTHEETFATRDARVEVGLAVAVTAELPEDLGQIRRFIQPDVDILAQMRRVVVETVGAELHSIAPEEFYTQFSNIDSAPPMLTGPIDLFKGAQDLSQNKRQQPVEAQLRDAIKAALEKTFCLRNIRIVPKMTDTDLTRRYRQLCSGIHTLDPIMVGSLTDGGASAEVPYLISFRVTGMVDGGWSIFQGNVFDHNDSLAEIEAIKQSLTKSLRSSLALLPPTLLEYRNEREWSQVHESARVAERTVAKAFGLSITFISFERDLSIDEQYIRNRHKKSVENADDKLSTALDDAKFSRAANSEDLKTMRAIANKRLRDGMLPTDDDLVAYLDVADSIQKNADALLDYQAPRRTSEPDVDVLRHIDTIIAPGKRVIQIAEQQQEKNSADDKSKRDQEPETENDNTSG